MKKTLQWGEVMTQVAQSISFAYSKCVQDGTGYSSLSSVDEAIRALFAEGKVLNVKKTLLTSDINLFERRLVALQKRGEAKHAKVFNTLNLFVESLRTRARKRIVEPYDVPLPPRTAQPVVGREQFLSEMTACQEALRKLEQAVRAHKYNGENPSSLKTQALEIRQKTQALSQQVSCLYGQERRDKESELKWLLKELDGQSNKISSMQQDYDDYKRLTVDQKIQKLREELFSIEKDPLYMGMNERMKLVERRVEMLRLILQQEGVISEFMKRLQKVRDRIDASQVFSKQVLEISSDIAWVHGEHERLIRYQEFGTWRDRVRVPDPNFPKEIDKLRAQLNDISQKVNQLHPQSGLEGAQVKELKEKIGARKRKCPGWVERSFDSMCDSVSKAWNGLFPAPEHFAYSTGEDTSHVYMSTPRLPTMDVAITSRGFRGHTVWQ